MAEKNKKRHVCRTCGRHRNDDKMKKVNDWHQGQYECAGGHIVVDGRTIPLK